MKQLFFSVFTFLSLQFSIAQEPCGHVQHMNYVYQKYPELKKQNEMLNHKVDQYIKARKELKTNKTGKIGVAETVYEIPVVFHVIYNNYAKGVTNISDQQIYSQLAILNKDYGRTNEDANLTYDIYKPVAVNTNIQFCLATIDPEGNNTTGIVRVFDNQTSFQVGDDDEIKLKQLSYWPSDQYLNIWVCNIAEPTIGYAQYPGYSNLPGLGDDQGPDFTDGVMLDYECFGTGGSSRAPYNLGRTATHEVGHWLGLIHIWGDSYCGDDYVSDTPVQTGANLGTSCEEVYSFCSGPSTLDMRQNYMDYSADKCMNLFTQGQKDRMRAVMEVSPRRMSLLNSAGCCPQETRTVVPQVVDFEDNSYLENDWQVLNFDAASPYSKQWTKVSPGAYGQSNTALMIENDSVYSSSSKTYWDVLQTPLMNLTRVEKLFLDFDLAYARNSSSSETDSLVIYYNLGCKDNWSVYKVLYNDDLVTTSRAIDDFIPNVDEWKRITIESNILKGKQRARFRIAVFSKGINKLYLDNINIYKESSAFQLSLYPVPTNGELNVEVTYSGYKDVKIEAFNTLGKKLFEREIRNSKSFSEPINIEELSAGVYLFRVTSGGDKLTKRVIKY